MEVSSQSFHLDGNDSLWLYTDGLLERPDRAVEDAGWSWLATIIARLRENDLQKWTDAVFAECEDLVGRQPPPDDMTLLSLTTLPES